MLRAPVPLSFTQCSGGIAAQFLRVSAGPYRCVVPRFGFHNASSIDTLLDRDDVALEDLLNEDDLLQECKAQNTRLIDYFQRLDVLKRLFGYVTGAIEGEDNGRFKYVGTK